LVEAFLINKKVPEISSKKKIVKNKRNIKKQKQVKNKMREESSNLEE
jgi:hypothetical protein